MDEEALREALESGKVASAALDVFAPEPPAAGFPLFKFDTVIATPHIGYVTRDEFDLQFSDAFDQINAFAAGTPVNVVNPDALASPR